jgi:DNA-binding GntR family transcriptional regulator
VLGQLKTKLRRVELAHFGAAARAHSSFREHAAILKALKGRSLPEAISSLRRNWQASLKRLTGSQQRRNDGR